MEKELMVYDKYDLSILKLCGKPVRCKMVRKNLIEYKYMTATNYFMNTLDDRAMQRLLRDVDNDDLALAMVGMDRDLRMRIFNNLSVRLAIYVAECMMELGSVSQEEIGQGSKKVFDSLVKLVDYEDIVCPEKNIILVFGELMKKFEEAK